MTSDASSTDGDDQPDWEFEQGDIAQKEHAKPSPVPGVSERNKDECKVERRLVDAESGERFYKVETEEGGSHVYSVKVLHLNYKPVSEDESRVWPKDDDGGMI